MPLNFSELYHKTALCCQTGIDVPGVYIWGFVYEKDGNKIGHPVNFTGNGNPVTDPNKHVFIPYYVGESSTSILSRLFDHIQPRKIDSSKKTRLTIGYIKEFFNDPNFPINSGLGIRNNGMSIIRNNGMSINASRFFSWIQLHNIGINRLQYFNNEIVMRHLYPNNFNLLQYNSYSNNNFPITLPAININDQQDSLNQLITHQSNFFFTFCKLNTSINLPKVIETYTTLSLKGKTLAEITGFRYWIDQINAGNFHNIIDNTGFNIFKQPNQLWVNPQGPFDISNIAFPGYL